MAERTYSEREIALILERAAKRQEATSARDDARRGGLTLAELAEVAAEAGIAPEHVAAVARDLPAGSAARARVLGLPAEATRSAVLSGSISDAAWGVLVADLRRTFGAQGVVSEVGGVRAWASAASENEVPVRASLEPEGAGVRLTLTQRPGELVAVLTALGVGLLTLVGLGILLVGTVPGDGLVILAFAAAVYAAVHFVYGRSIRKLEVQFEGLLDRAEALLAHDEVPAPRETAPPAAASRLDLDALPDAPDASEPEGRTRRTRT